MQIRLMGTSKQNYEFIKLLKQLPEITIISESRSYTNRGNDIRERVYIELEVNTVYHDADMVDEFLPFEDLPEHFESLPSELC